MEDMVTFWEKIPLEKVIKAVISNPKSKELSYDKINIIAKCDGYQVEQYTAKQVFHENIDGKRLKEYMESRLEDGYGQLNVWDDAFEYSIRVSKKGKILFKRNECKQKVKVQKNHNRKKQYLLEEGTLIEPLIDMGIFTKEGKIVVSMYDKYKQINKFIEIIDQSVSKSGLEEFHIIDFGCGKSYLTFIVYYYFTEIKKKTVHMVGLDLKEDVIGKCNQAAKKYGYDNLEFQVGDIDGYKTKMPVDMVISLHACDTATDYALYNAIKWDAKMIFSVPCCQHELCAQMESEEYGILGRYGIIKERCAALFTDAIRGNLLEANGYKTQLLEFVDLSHTPKNILIRASKANITKKHKQKMMQEVENLCEEFHLEPTLLRLLNED